MNDSRRRFFKQGASLAALSAVGVAGPAASGAAGLSSPAAPVDGVLRAAAANVLFPDVVSAEERGTAYGI